MIELKSIVKLHMKFNTLISGAFNNTIEHFICYLLIQFIFYSKHSIKMSGNTAPTFAPTFSSRNTVCFPFRPFRNVLC